MTVRVIAAGRTGPNRDLRFGSEHHDLDETGRRDCRRLVEGSAGLTSVGVAFCGPEASVVQTADLLGIHAGVDAGLCSLDLGRWQGRAPEDIPVGELRDWFTDVASVPHGGESIADFVARIGDWLDRARSPEMILVVSMPVAQAVIACATHGGPHDYWSIEVEPASEHTVSLPLDSGGDRCHSDTQK
ncbi:Broad specificity phosphatase PhoE [Williamsia maris]|uniref:Broad specificity phosphatase PhoE n=1 Tax=Williamsia maris TaxID=72806 RepID=A0ABT1H9H7_9NOCA|nr:Broad specificity phosphatase PhoE [Williamsia maris]